jgi:hypothetical protein
VRSCAGGHAHFAAGYQCSEQRPEEDIDGHCLAGSILPLARSTFETAQGYAGTAKIEVPGRQNELARSTHGAAFGGMHDLSLTTRANRNDETVPEVQGLGEFDRKTVARLVLIGG